MLGLVGACASAGTDYADLSGEVLFIRERIDRYHDVAAGTGTRIVHCCGFDSIPSDLGVLLLHHAARADDAGDLQDTTLVVTALKGGVSGGTLASGMGQWDEIRASAERRRVVADPYALSPDRAAEPDLGDEGDLEWVSYDRDLRMWAGQFLMAGLNTRLVRRSNALQGWAHGRRFRYREVTGFGASPAAPVQAAALAAALKALTGDGYRARRPAQIGGPHPGHAADHPVTAAHRNPGSPALPTARRTPATSRCNRSRRTESRTTSRCGDQWHHDA